MEPEKVVARGEDGNIVFEVETADNKTHETGKLVPKLVNGRPLYTSWKLPKFFNFGVAERERRLLFDHIAFLRKVGAEFERPTLAQELNWSDGDAPVQRVKKPTTEENIAYEQSLGYWLGRVLDLKNSNAAGLAFENKRRIISAFSEGQTNDTGRIEVQGNYHNFIHLFIFANASTAALLTHRIHNLWEHIQQFKRDIHNRRRLLELIHARAKILKYLRRTARARYEAVLPQLGLERGAIEDEIIVTREMFRTGRVTA
jgi:small subunit ribosomal protein S15